MKQFAQRTASAQTGDLFRFRPPPPQGKDRWGTPPNPRPDAALDAAAGRRPAPRWAALASAAAEAAARATGATRPAGSARPATAAVTAPTGAARTARPAWR